MQQPTINIGLIGHVAHGKSTIINSLTGIKTSKFKSELEKNITIKLGYANCKIFKCDNCIRPSNYKSTNGNVEQLACKCGTNMKLVRHVSFVDCPGHDVLMSTMLNGASVMDVAILVVASNEPFPQKQTIEHAYAIELLNLKDVIILQNKIDLVKESDAFIHYEKIRDYFNNIDIIPISFEYNIDILCEYIVTKIPEPQRNILSYPKITIVRSFDINKPDEKINGLKGGICGGTLLQGKIKVGDEIEIRPGLLNLEKNEYTPLFGNITSIFSENNSLLEAVPGGLLGIGTNLDPYLTKEDKLVGHVMGLRGKLPDVYNKIDIHYSFTLKNIKILKGDCFIINIGSTTTCGKVEKIKDDDCRCRLVLTIPICANIGDKVVLSKRMNKHQCLIGNGEIIRGNVMTSAY